jgi:translation elongation factor EF-1alpha
MSSSGRATKAEHHNTDQIQQMTQISSAQGVALLKTYREMTWYKNEPIIVHINTAAKFSERAHKKRPALSSVLNITSI